MINGETQMKYAGSSIGAPRSTILSQGFPPEGGPADVKKTFLYNQKLTTELFSVLEEHPDKEAQSLTLVDKVQ